MSHAGGRMGKAAECVAAAGVDAVHDAQNLDWMPQDVLRVLLLQISHELRQFAS